MKWSYGDLMDLPADLYGELIEFLSEQPKGMDVDDF